MKKGFLNLSAIPKDKIKTMDDGAKGVWIEVCERRAPSPSGCTDFIRLSRASKEEQTIYIGNLKPVIFDNNRQQNQSAPETPPPAPEENDDLPF